MPQFKTRREYEAEDGARHRRRLEEARRRQEQKRAQGFDCPFEGCSEHFDSPSDLNEHRRKHLNDSWRNMKCTKPQCKDLKVYYITGETKLQTCHLVREQKGVQRAH